MVVFILDQIDLSTSIIVREFYWNKMDIAKEDKIGGICMIKKLRFVCVSCQALHDGFLAISGNWRNILFFFLICSRIRC